MKLVIGLDQLRLGVGERDALAFFVLIIEGRSQVGHVIGEVRVGLAFGGK
jgi:hypothetical protein